MDNQKKQVVDKLKAAKNVLVTVSNDPSIDQLAACLGLTLMLTKLGKHASAVFSGEVPSVIDFLKPEETLETNTNSLRDFIIALDKAKADKLRYKVEDKVVRIFITPYKTSIGEQDLEFSEGDFNVDIVIALGVREQQAIDQAVTAHGNILHDATVISVTTSEESQLGSLRWRDPAASGVSELAASLSDSFDKNVLDEQIATAFLTGIVAQTERFSNNLTASSTMSVSAKLMSAGANQQLVATELEAPPEPKTPPLEEGQSSAEGAESTETSPADNNDGALEIDHDYPEDASSPENSDLSSPRPDLNPPDNMAEERGNHETAMSDDNGSQGDNPINRLGDPDTSGESTRGSILSGEGPESGHLTANTEEERLDPASSELDKPAIDQPILSHDDGGSLKSRFGKRASRIFQTPKQASSGSGLIGSGPMITDSADKLETGSAGVDYEALQSEPNNGSGPDETTPGQTGDNLSTDQRLSEARPQTLDDIESSVHSAHQVDHLEPFEDTPTPNLSPATSEQEEHLPSVTVGPNGELIHEDQSAEPAPASTFQPAPGFPSVSPAMTMPAPAIKPLQPQTLVGDTGDNPPPPAPPPIV